jgi:hypothetical protein
VKAVEEVGRASCVPFSNDEQPAVHEPHSERYLDQLSPPEGNRTPIYPKHSKKPLLGFQPDVDGCEFHPVHRPQLNLPETMLQTDTENLPTSSPETEPQWERFRTDSRRKMMPLEEVGKAFTAEHIQGVSLQSTEPHPSNTHELLLERNRGDRFQESGIPGGRSQIYADPEHRHLKIPPSPDDPHYDCPPVHDRPRPEVYIPRIISPCDTETVPGISDTIVPSESL